MRERETEKKAGDGRFWDSVWRSENVGLGPVASLRVRRFEYGVGQPEGGNGVSRERFYVDNGGGRV